MKAGKLSNTVLKRSIFKRIKKRGDFLEEKPGAGSECAILNCGNAKEVILSSASGRWPVYAAANHIAAKGGQLASVQCGIFLGETTEEAELKLVVSELERQCEKLGVPISGGHTQIVPASIKSLIQVTGVGFSSDRSKREKVKAGYELVAVGDIGVSGIRRIVELKQDEILQRYSQDVIDRAVGEERELLGIEAAEKAYKEGAVHVHAISQGGIYAALWNLSEYAGMGFDVDFRAIPVRQEIIELCEIFDVNPYELESVGAVLVVVEHGSAIVEEMKQMGLHAAVIGRMVEGNQKIIRNQEEIRYLDIPQPDELEKFSQEI